MADDVLIDLILHGSEERNLEYKSSFPWSKSGANVKARVIKTVLGMANITDGGVVVVGVTEDNGTFNLDGMNARHIATFTQDRVQADVNAFADPYVEVTVSPRQLEDGKKFIVIQVRPFDQIPVICKKDGPERLRSGAMYTRPRRKIETVEVPSQTEMREIVERAVDSGVAMYLERARRLGLLPSATPPDFDAKRFEEQLKGL